MASIDKNQDVIKRIDQVLYSLRSIQDQLRFLEKNPALFNTDDRDIQLLAGRRAELVIEKIDRLQKIKSGEYKVDPKQINEILTLDILHVINPLEQVLTVTKELNNYAYYQGEMAKELVLTKKESVQDLDTNLDILAKMKQQFREVDTFDFMIDRIAQFESMEIKGQAIRSRLLSEKGNYGLTNPQHIQAKKNINHIHNKLVQLRANLIKSDIKNPKLYGNIDRAIANLKSYDVTKFDPIIVNNFANYKMQSFDNHIEKINQQVQTITADKKAQKSILARVRNFLNPNKQSSNLVKFNRLMGELATQIAVHKQVSPTPEIVASQVSTETQVPTTVQEVMFPDVILPEPEKKRVQINDVPEVIFTAVATEPEPEPEPAPDPEPEFELPLALEQPPVTEPTQSIIATVSSDLPEPNPSDLKYKGVVSKSYTPPDHIKARNSGDELWKMIANRNQVPSDEFSYRSSRRAQTERANNIINSIHDIKILIAIVKDDSAAPKLKRASSHALVKIHKALERCGEVRGAADEKFITECRLAMRHASDLDLDNSSASTRSASDLDSGRDHNPRTPKV